MASEAQATQFTTAFPSLRTRGRSVSEQTSRVGTWLRQSLCALQGHERYLHVDGSRVTLRCVGCQHDSPGWDTGDRAYQRTYAGDPNRHKIR
jgi:hypothetical protein